MDYSFEPFLRSLETNWFDDDPLLASLLDRYAGRGAWDRDGLSRWGARVAGPLQELARESALTPGRPGLRHHDAHGRRVDRVLLADATARALDEVHGREGLGVVHADPFVFYARGYLYGQNGEAGVVCSLGCTDGLVRVLEALGDHEELHRAVERIRGSSMDRVWHGAQFVTEPQGGSDVPANRTEATMEDGTWRIRGRKWFCSNVNADYFLVTARPAGGGGGGREDGPALFLVPAFIDEDAEDAGAGAGAPRRNGHTIDRLKEKLGTRELATAEVTFHGAAAHPVGPLDRGLSNLLRYVLTTSRFYCVQSAASTLRQAERVAGAYVRFRTAFGRTLTDFPLVQERMAEIRAARRRALAAYFELLRLWEASDTDATAARDFRILLSLAKPVFTATATRLTHEAMILLGGNGIEERFSSLPRLYRDSAIMEIWEGPHDVLYTQALRDLDRLEVDGREFVARVTGRSGGRGASASPGESRAAEGNGVEEAGDALARLLDGAEADRDDVTVPFRRLAPGIVAAWADRVLSELPPREDSHGGGPD